METEIVDGRKERGMAIAKTSKISKSSKGYVVPSQSGNGNYIVKTGALPDCSCPDCQTRRVKCKHIWAVEYYLKQTIDSEGNITTTQATRITYTQDWSAYNKAQTNEGELFTKYLYDLCGEIENPEYHFGRPTLPMSDMVFGSALKVYSQFSLRRFISMMRKSKEEGYLEKVCSYSSVSNYMRKKELTPILQDLIKKTSLPLSAVETTFAVDSTGFSTCRFARYFSYKHGKDLRYKTWVKAHISCGTKTNVITAVKVTEERCSDHSEFKGLVEKTSENFRTSEVCADKAYLSRENLDFVEEKFGTPYIPFKSNSTGHKKGSSMWRRMYHYFEFNRDEFLAHYHQRSNVETTFHMIKTKFGDDLKSKDEVSLVNEVLLKILCHNIVCLIHEMFELGIEVKFH